MASTTIYARIKAGITSVPTASSALGNATVKASIYQKLAGIKTVQFVGTATGFATTIPAVDTLSASPDLAYFKTLKITANSLTSDLMVTAGSNLEIATDTLFASPQSSLILPSVGDTVYVRLKKGLPLGTIKDESTKVTISSSGFLTKVIQFLGNSIESTGFIVVNMDNVKFVSLNGGLKAYGVLPGKQINIFNSLGQLVKSTTSTDNTYISIATKGLYFVKVGSFVQKVIVR